MNPQASPFSTPVSGAAESSAGPGAPVAPAFPRAQRTRIMPAALVEAFRLADALAIMVCVTFAFVRVHEGPLLGASIGAIGPYYAAGVLMCWLLATSGAYRWVGRPEQRLAPVLAPLLGYSAAAALAGVAMAAALGAGARLPEVAEGLWTGVFCIVALHCAYWGMRARLNANGALRERIAIIGVTDTAARLIARAHATGEAEIVAVFHDRESTDLRTLSGVPIVGDVMDLLEWPQLAQVDRVVVCLDPLERKRLAAVLARVIALPHPVALAMETPRFGDAPPAVTLVAGVPAAILSGASDDPRREGFKRLADLVGAGVALLALLPVFVTLFAVLRLERHGPALAAAPRYGRNNVVFQALSFRANSPFGRWLSACGLTGLPQLLNVARGDMALVGPQGRPVGLLVEGVDPFTRLCDYAYRHRVKPGLTGLAQVNGWISPDPTAEALEAALAYDLTYVRGYGFWLDLNVMLRSLPAAIGLPRPAR